MTTHVRQQIRAKAVSLLRGLATTGPNVYPGRSWPTGAAQLPALLVYTRTEQAQDATMMAQTLQLRTVELVVEGRCRTASQEPDDELDEIALEVETALLASGAFGTLIKSIELKRSISASLASQDRRSGEIELTFDIEYLTAAGAPATAL
ncbi:MAG TPA: hypothetical protein VFB13_17850 [Reyranella sp.]|jgi:hypothetical protein|nr:hypothetical protein [Reyranella sp.]